MPTSENKAMRPADKQTFTGANVEAWQFSGDGKKPPITIKASSHDDAIKEYEEYLNK